MVNSPDEELDSTASHLVRYRAGGIIFRQGHPAGDMFIVEDGEVELVKEGEPEEVHLATFQRGDFFGEHSLLDGVGRHATARALTDSRLLAIDADALDRLIREHPGTSMMMLRKLSRRLTTLEIADRSGGTGSNFIQAVSTSDEALKEAEQPADSKSTPASACLLHVNSGTRFPLAHGENLIGRLDPATGVSPQIDLAELDLQRSLSRRHACVCWTDGTFVVREESGTANGTFLSGVRLQSDQPYDLQHGDRLRVGQVELVFEIAQAR